MLREELHRIAGLSLLVLVTGVSASCRGEASPAPGSPATTGTPSTESPSTAPATDARSPTAAPDALLAAFLATTQAPDRTMHLVWTRRELFGPSDMTGILEFDFAGDDYAGWSDMPRRADIFWLAVFSDEHRTISADGTTISGSYENLGTEVSYTFTRTE